MACLDRSGDIAGVTGVSPPIIGREAVRSLVLDVGLADPEDSGVNCLLETLRVARDLDDSDEETVVALLAGGGDTVSAGRSIGAQIDELRANHGVDSAVVVTDSANAQQLVPVIESRLPVDSIDRVIVRQARDIESTYYLLKQFLADEDLRRATLVPLGIALLAFPVLMTYVSPGAALASITAVFGLFVLYKGLGIDAYLASVPSEVRDALYSGQVSVVTYVVAAGLALIGMFAGAIGVSELANRRGLFVSAMQFTFDGVPWFAMAALVASAGHLLDETIRDAPVATASLNLPFGAIALGIVVRGFAAYFLQRSGVIAPTWIPTVDMGAVSIGGIVLSPGQYLAVFVALGIVVSLVGVRAATYFGGPSPSEADPTD